MTRYQIDNVVNKAHDLLDKQGCVCVKAIIRPMDFRGMRSESDLRRDVDYSVQINETNAVLYSTIIEEDAYDAHNRLGYILSELIYRNPIKMECM